MICEALCGSERKKCFCAIDTYFTQGESLFNKRVGRRIEMIKKVKEGYKVVSEKTGRNLGGPYKTKEEAKKRLRQVEFFKRQKG